MAESPPRPPSGPTATSTPTAPGEDAAAAALMPAPTSQPARQPQRQRIRRWLTIAKHRLQNWLSQRTLFERILYMLAWAYLPILGAISAGVSHATMLGILFLIGSRLIKGWRDASPEHMRLLQEGYLARKLLLYKLIRKMHRAESMSDGEVQEFRTEGLQLIAQFVRAHRRDLHGSQVFANLLILDGDAVVVVARDRDHRGGRARYPRVWMASAQAVERGEPVVVGDVYIEYPDTPKGKRYRSILALPVFFNGAVVGAVSVDSSRPYDFHADSRNLNNYLMPYVALLAWTLDDRHVTGFRDALKDGPS